MKRKYILTQNQNEECAMMGTREKKRVKRQGRVTPAKQGETKIIISVKQSNQTVQDEIYEFSANSNTHTKYTWRRNSFCSSEYRNANADSGMAAAAVKDEVDDDDDDDDDDDSAGDDESRGSGATRPFIRMRRTFSRTASAERPV